MTGRWSPRRLDRVAGAEVRLFSTRIAAACLVAALLTACGESEKSTPTVTSMKRLTIVTPTPRFGGPDARNTPVPVTYVVQPGDTLSLIAIRYRVPENKIQSLNHLADPDSVYSGQKLLIPPASD